MAPTPMTAEEIARVVTDLEDAVRAYVRWCREEKVAPRSKPLPFSISDGVRAIVGSTLRDCGVSEDER